MSDSQTIDVYNRRVSDYAALTGKQQEYSTLDAFAENLPDGGYLLDLGCGPGAAASHLAKLGFRVDAIDASEEMVCLANSQPGVDARCADFADVAAISVYDGIWANFSLLHVKSDEFPVILSALQRALKPGGIFHIGMKLGEGSTRDNLGRFYTYYSEDELQTHLHNSGFSILSVELGEGCGLAGTVDPWILMLCVVPE